MTIIAVQNILIRNLNNLLIAIDVDTIGPSLQRHALVEIGAVAVNEITGAVVGTFLELLHVPARRGWDAK